MTSDEASWCAIAPLIGCLLGALLAANIADRIGRKYTILIMAPVVFGCQIGIGYVRNVWYLSFLRMIIGITEGACYTALPMYLGEIASPDIRGFLSSLITSFFILGMLLVNTLGAFLSIWTSSMISAIIPAIHFLGFLFMPELPYFYIKGKKFEQAERSLRILRGTTIVAEEMEALKGAVRCRRKWRTAPNSLICSRYLLTEELCSS
ncbi:hypothetical protein JTB14_016621 [Gonioctena quinquepunctata]|nr:hypothetical protein JTB14_016621 [Gonioctena quinquepunctata]